MKIKIPVSDKPKDLEFAGFNEDGDTKWLYTIPLSPKSDIPQIKEFSFHYEYKEIDE